jgi:hypothetical protein
MALTQEQAAKSVGVDLALGPAQKAIIGTGLVLDMVHKLVQQPFLEDRVAEGIVPGTFGQGGASR